jgi:thiol-disulfide isomerase/thioredoxin
VRSRSPGTAVVALVAAVLLAGCTGTPIGSDSSTQDQNFVAGDSAVTTWPAGERTTAPDVSARTLEGGSFSLADYRGKTVVLNFWASWCAPCRVETPALQVLAHDLASQGVVFVGVDSRDDPDAARAFLADIKGADAPVDYPNIDDSSGDVALSFHSLVPPAFPSTLVVDRTGKVAARVDGATTGLRLKALLESLLGSSSPAPSS